MKRECSTEAEFSLYVGLDWGTEFHRACVLNPSGKSVKECRIDHSGDAISEFLRSMIVIAGGQADRVAVAIEVPRGPIVEAFLEGGCAVFSINPKQLVTALGREHPESQEHRDVGLMLSLPGLGCLIAANLFTEGADPVAQRDYAALRAQSGIAPVTRQSGKSKQVIMRRGCSQRLRNAMYHWARCSVQHDALSKSHYTRLRGAGHNHGRALRGVADRLLLILMAMLKNGQPYDAKRRQVHADAA
jgi:hypothetical protein